MSERFNSSHGGYTCDNCSVLLWTGVEGSKYPEKRIYCYGSTEADIVEKDGQFYCNKCIQNQNKKENVIK